MRLEFVSRAAYSDKGEPAFIDGLKRRFGDFYMLPEGGTNALAVKGCGEILSGADAHFDYICCAAGTGGTVAGIANSARPHQKVLAFPAVRGGFIGDEISRWTDKRVQVIEGYEIGGYAKTDDRLIAFINDFHRLYDVPLDPVYTGKMIFGVMDLIAKGFFPENSKILAIHTGGLQGIAGMNKLLKRKRSISIDFDV
jgi:1-aminocyclopropane-1-carboxylate deaminase